MPISLNHFLKSLVQKSWNAIHYLTIYAEKLQNVCPMTQAHKLIVGNWKMHKTVAEAKEHIQRLKPAVSHSSVDVWLAVPYTALFASSEISKGSPIEIGAQNMSDLLGGAMTGEISALMIIEAGASFVLLGHSERRRIFQEADAMINRKVKLALRTGLKALLCIGETKQERDAGQTASIIQQQLRKGLDGVSHEQLEQILIAYEPVWAIGNQTPATPEIVEEIHHLCKNTLINEWGSKAESVRIVYGGSVSPSNAQTFLQLKSVDGLLVGGSSLDLQAFIEIIHQGEKVQ